MDSMDLPTHQLILNELALNLAEQASSGQLAPGDSSAAFFGRATSSKVQGGRKYLSAPVARTQIALALFAKSISSASHATAHAGDEANDEHLVPVLEELLGFARELPAAELEETMDFGDWPLADQLAFALASSLLTVARNAPHHRHACVGAVVIMAEQLANSLSSQAARARDAVVHFAPMLHGIYRALASVAYRWTLPEFARLAVSLEPLASTGPVVRRLNDAMMVLPEQLAAKHQADRATRRKPKQPTVRRRDADGDVDDDARSDGSVDTFFSGDEEAGGDDDAEAQGAAAAAADTAVGQAATLKPIGQESEEVQVYAAAVLSHYRSAGRPLSGYFVLCAAIESLSSVLAQSLATYASPPVEGFADYQKLALDQDRIDPARAPEPQRFDIDAGTKQGGVKQQQQQQQRDTEDATHAAWASLLRYTVRKPKEGGAGGHEQHQNGNANGAEADGGGGRGSSILASLPLIGGRNQTAAFGGDDAAGGAGIPDGLATAARVASRAYHDLQRFIESEGPKRGELFADLYALEILSESLKLASLTNVAQARVGEASIDSHTIVRIRGLLSEAAIVFEPVVQTAALQSTGLLVRNFPGVATASTTQLRRFITSPLAMFQAGGSPASERGNPVLAGAAKCLAVCVTMVRGDDLLVSTIHTLLNYLGSGSAANHNGGLLRSHGAAGAALGTAAPLLGGGAAAAASIRSGRSGLSRAVTGRDYSLTGSTSQQALATRTESQRQLIAANTIYVVSRLALEVDKPEVTALTISMLLQKLRTADDATEAAILANVAPLAIVAPKLSFVDVARALSAVSRSALTGGANRRAAGSVQAAQHRLAVLLGHVSERDDASATERPTGGDPEAEDDDLSSSSRGGQGRKELYLVELLQLFAEKGLQLQSSLSSGKASREEAKELTADLAGLLPAIAALLEHGDINPQLEPRAETVSLFRNMWFLSVVFGLVDPRSRTPRSLRELSRAPRAMLCDADAAAEALARISLKTPTLVPETASNYLESELEFNSVLKRDFGAATLDAQRKALSALIPSHAGEIRSMRLPQVTFLLTIYSLECTRSAMGLPTMVLWYFVNEGLNSSALSGSMDAIADKVISFYLEDLAAQTNEHSLDPRVSTEVKNLLLGSCHRVDKVRRVSRRFLDRLIPAYPSLLISQDLVFTLLEMLTLLRLGCEGRFKDEFSPVYHYRSERANVELDLGDSYPQREALLAEFLARARRYLGILLGRAPVEMQGILQRYLGTFDDASLPSTSELGKSVAVDFARALPGAVGQEAYLPDLGGWRADSSSSFVGELSAKSTYLGEMTGVHLALSRGLLELQRDPTYNFSAESVAECKRQLAATSRELVERPDKSLAFADVRRLLYRSAALAVALPQPDFDLIHHIVAIPLRVFTPAAITAASHVWTWIIGERPTIETKVMVEITLGYASAIKNRRGIFSSSVVHRHPLYQRVEMSQTDFGELARERERATSAFAPHLTLTQLLSSRFQAFRYRDPAMVLALVRLVQRAAAATHLMSDHPLAREARFALVVFGFRVVQGSKLDGLVEFQLRKSLLKMAFGWFGNLPQWSYGSSRLQISAEMALLRELLEVLRGDQQRSAYVITSFAGGLESVRLPGQLSLPEAARHVGDGRALLQLLVEDELSRFSVWSSPSDPSGDFVGELTRTMNDASWRQMVRIAWRLEPDVAVSMAQRFTPAAVRSEAARLVRAQPAKVVANADAVQLFTEDHLKLASKEKAERKWLLYWAPVSPVEAVELFLPAFGNDPTVLQYAMRSLRHHPVEITFFYVPQVVQALRDDEYGYVEQFIFETSKTSQLFCHQIIWNMKANSFKDDDGEVADPMKPTLDRMVDSIVGALSGEAQDFYNREFGFFNEVTSISGKLKPYIKKSKAEKKAKIDEEMAKIKVDPGVYLPSNPDGVVVDLARKSGRPLQSHAKAPFMATFKVQRELVKGSRDASNNTFEAWQSAIFKVGDDCRQDVLALQCIAMMKNIFGAAGLHLYFFPYRVTATGPGMGVIDVVPNATSRDEMGRASVNDIKTFFVQRYGPETSIAYQKARMNFISSLAAYSLACYLLQIRDRHNGNIMVDGNGHIIHIDFGFLFTIGPGGMKFESEFKLSKEYIDILGDDGFQMFKSLFIRGYLALRPYMNQLVSMVHLMLATDLPSFKTGYAAITELQERFVPHLSERNAARFAEELISAAYMSRRALFYDFFQEKQNGIPYTR